MLSFKTGYRWVKSYYIRIKNKVDGLIFDWHFHIETRKILDRFELDVDNENKQGASSYVPSVPSRFIKIIKMLDIDPNDYVFVDIGSGKGRALILAAEAGFTNMIGVEFSPSLHQKALANLARYRPIIKNKHLSFKLINIDAMHAQIPESRCVLFLFNPFQGKAMKKFMQHLKDCLRNRKEPLYFLYVHPTKQELVRQSGLFDKVSEQSEPVDTILYKFIARSSPLPSGERVRG